MQSIETLTDEIVQLAAHLNAATARLLTLIAEFDERNGWVETGCKSCAHWVSWRCAVSPHTAREHVRVAHRLRELPLVAAAFARGELSYSKVRALTRVEKVEREDELIELGRAATAAQLERIVRGYRSVLDVEDDAARAHEKRELSWYWDDHGALVFRGRLPAEQGALLVQAIEAARDGFGPPTPQPEDVSADMLQALRAASVRTRNADALMTLTEASLADAENSSTADRYQVVVHVDAEALQAHANHDSAHRCELEAGVPLPPEAARRLTCDASLLGIIERDGDPLRMGRKKRTITPGLRRALQSRDGGCAFPGCTQTRHVDAHHIRHWADGGRTDLENLVQLCRRHHRFLHEKGFTVQKSGSTFMFMTPDGRPLPHSPRSPRGDCAALTTRNGPVRVSAEALTHRDGEPMEDLGMCVDALFDVTRPRRRRE